MRIAPTLVAGLEVAASRKPYSQWPQALAELRALLAVARAAAQEIEDYRDANGKNIGGGHAASCFCKLCRALARLERVSQGIEPRKRRSVFYAGKLLKRISLGKP